MDDLNITQFYVILANYVIFFSQITAVFLGFFYCNHFFVGVLYSKMTLNSNTTYNTIFFSWLPCLPYLGHDAVHSIDTYVKLKARLHFLFPPKGGCGFLMSPPCLESQGLSVWSHLSIIISSFVLLLSPVAFSVFLSFSGFGPFSWHLFSLNLHFPKGLRSFVWRLFWGIWFFERLGDEYFSWWYVQRIMLRYFQVFLSIPFYNVFDPVLKRQTETVNGTSIS